MTGTGSCTAAMKVFICARQRVQAVDKPLPEINSPNIAELFAMIT